MDCCACDSKMLADFRSAQAFLIVKPQHRLADCKSLRSFGSSLSDHVQMTGERRSQKVECRWFRFTGPLIVKPPTIAIHDGRDLAVADPAKIGQTQDARPFATRQMAQLHLFDRNPRYG